MADIHREFVHRRKVALEAGHNEVMWRLIGFLDWMEEVPAIKKMIRDLDEEGYGTLELEQVLKRTRYDKHPETRNLEAISSFGWALIEHMRAHHESLQKLAENCGIYGRKRGEEPADAALARYIIPFFDYVEHRLPPPPVVARKDARSAPPANIVDSLKRFNAANRGSELTCFIMMRFGRTGQHKKIEKVIKDTLSKHRINGVLARDREFNDDLLPNILTYLHGCDFGIAVFERLETDEFNPNVALEVGYMLGLKKHVLLLKDRTLKALHTVTW